MSVYAFGISCAAAQNSAPISKRDVPASTKVNVCTMRFSEEVLTRELLSYRVFDERLLMQDQQTLSGFNIFVDEFGVGHLYPTFIEAQDYPRIHPKTSEIDGRFSDWKDVMTFLKPGAGWTLLSRDEAIALWGEHRKNKDFDGSFCTFDARSMHADEPNLYHFDLRFDNNGQVIAYRVRGIGIVHPQWVDNNELDNLRKRRIYRHTQRRKAAESGKWLEFDEHDMGK
ncbi:MAG: hypothetical protein K2Y39_20680 [Candidatus Obscuribacterales bacterium]|nr:hypothetical protein [Candidatus Obscuribacterales bacterium]